MRESAEVPDLFGDMSTDLPEPTTPRQTGAIKNVDPLAWLHESGIEVVDNPESPSYDLFDAENAHLGLQDASAADPLGWLQGYGGDEMLTEAAAEENAQPDRGNEQAPATGDDDADPLAWLNETDANMVGVESTASSGSGDDPLDWLADETLLDEALSLEELVESPNASQVSNPDASSVGEDGQEDMSDEHDNNLDWLNSDDEEPEGGELPEWLTEMPVNESTPSAEDEIPDWMSDLSSEEEPQAEAQSSDMDMEAEPAGADMPDWLSDMSPEQESQAEDEPEQSDDIEWMSEVGVQEIEVANTESMSADLPDWLSDVSPEEEPLAETEAEPADGDEFEWMSEVGGDQQTDELEFEPAEANVDVPDWLSDVSPEEQPLAETEAEPADGDEFEWMSEVGSDQQTDEPEFEPAEANVDVPDWLSDVSPEEEPLAETEAEPADGDEFEWMSEVGSDQQTDEPEFEPAEANVDVPDWLSDVSPEEEPLAETEAEPADGDEFEWMSEVGSDQQTDEPEFEPAEANVDVPDWLSDVSPEEEPLAETEAEPADGDEFEWMSEVGSDQQTDEPEFEPAEANADVPDWLSDVSPEEEPLAETEAEPADGDEFEWMSEVGSDQQTDEAEFEPAEANVDVPDWLSDVSPEEEPLAETEAEPADGDEFEWMSEASEEPEEVAALRAEGDDLEIIDGIGPATAEALRQAGITTFTQIAEMSPAELHHIVTVDQHVPMVVDTTESWPQQAQYLVDGDIQGFYAYQHYLVGGRLPEQESPDTETEMMEEFPANEGEAVLDDENSFEWMSEDVDDAVSATQEDIPDWLSEVSPSDEESSEPEPESETPDWLSSAAPRAAETARLDEPEEIYEWETELGLDNSEQETESGDALPDWLNHIQSQQQSDTISEPVDSTLGNEFSWIDDINAPIEEEGTSPEPILAEVDEQGEDDFSFDDTEEADLSDESATSEVPAAPTPANNAPDWLNAMVPGLDVDYDAPEDEPIEQSFIEMPDGGSNEQIEQVAPIRNRREFDWLNNIVEEESQQINAIQDKGRRRFIFSRQPAWLRRPTEGREAAPKGKSTMVNDDDFDDDVDVPPWLQ